MATTCPITLWKWLTPRLNSSLHSPLTQDKAAKAARWKSKYKFLGVRQSAPGNTLANTAKHSQWLRAPGIPGETGSQWRIINTPGPLRTQPPAGCFIDLPQTKCGLHSHKKTWAEGDLCPAISDPANLVMWPPYLKPPASLILSEENIRIL